MDDGEKHKQMQGLPIIEYIHQMNYKSNFIN